VTVIAYLVASNYGPVIRTPPIQECQLGTPITYLKRHPSRELSWSKRQILCTKNSLYCCQISKPNT